MRGSEEGWAAVERAACAGYTRAPFWGARTVRSIPLEAVFPYIHKPELFRLSWGRATRMARSGRAWRQTSKHVWIA